MAIKATFTFDEVTAHRLNDAAQRLSKPKSEIVREAINEYWERIGKLSPAERERKLRILDRMLASPPTRPQAEVDRELRDLRRARHWGGRRTPVE